MVSVVVLLLALPLAAQSLTPGADRRNDGDLGRTGFQWQGEQGMELAALRDMEAQLGRLSETEWKEKAVAWMVFEMDEPRSLRIPEAFHIGELDAGESSDVVPTRSRKPGWDLSFSGKAPRELRITLTDVNSTEVSCPLRPVLKKSDRGFLGVFVRDGVVVCLPRPGEPV